MIDQQTYERIRRDYRDRGEFSPELYRLLMRLVAATARSGLPPALSPTGRWDQDAAAEAAHEWIEARLLRTNALLAAFDYAQKPRQFLRSLEQNFRHHLQNRRQGDELGNLLSRSSRLLRDDDRFDVFVDARRTSDRWWGLVEWTDPAPWQGSDEALIAEAWAVGPVELFRYSTRVERASPILATDELARFLEKLMNRLERLLTIALLAVVYRDRFDLGTPPSLALDDRVDAEVADTERPSGDEVGEAAIAVLAELSGRQVRALILRAKEKTLEEIADAIGTSRGTADNELKRCGSVIDRYCADGIEREMILEKILDNQS